jgi:hypothetical protein
MDEELHNSKTQIHMQTNKTEKNKRSTTTNDVVSFAEGLERKKKKRRRRRKLWKRTLKA